MTHPAQDPPALRLSGLLDALLAAAAAGAVAGTLLGFLPGWPFELFSHFRMQWLAAAVTAALLLAVRCWWRTAALLGACAAVNLLLVGPYLPWRSGAAPGPSEVTVLLANVLRTNPDPAPLLALIRREQPDIVALMEVDERWEATLTAALPEYPHQLWEARQDNFGIALLSRHPCTGCRVLRLGPEGLPTVAGRFAIPTSRGDPTRFTLVGTHPLPPVGSRGARSNRAQIEAIGVLLASTPGPRILVGDLNATPWSAAFRQMVRRSGLTDSGRTHGAHGTFPVDIPPMRIPIDHFLSSGLTVVRRERGPDIGSDHFPLIVGFRG